jgi:hypothetical protein
MLSESNVRGRNCRLIARSWGHRGHRFRTRSFQRTNQRPLRTWITTEQQRVYLFEPSEDRLRTEMTWCLHLRLPGRASRTEVMKVGIGQPSTQLPAKSHRATVETFISQLRRTGYGVGIVAASSNSRTSCQPQAQAERIDESTDPVCRR